MVLATSYRFGLLWQTTTFNTSSVSLVVPLAKSLSVKIIYYTMYSLSKMTYYGAKFNLLTVSKRASFSLIIQTIEFFYRSLQKN